MATQVAVGALKAPNDLRSGGLDEGHVLSLVELRGKWPPLLLWAHDRSTVIDGAHRLAAARRLGLSTLSVLCFEGSYDEAFAESVRRNVTHGLPLSLGDRLRAGERILSRNHDLSDRRIAAICALSPKTVARLREDLASKEGAAVVKLGARRGKDGRVRPAREGTLQQRILEALAQNPGSSLRQIASLVGASPETVRRVRLQMAQSQSSEPVPDRGPLLPRNKKLRPRAWHEDRALSSREGLKDLIEWFERTDPGVVPYDLVRTIPLSRVYEMADEARRRSATWSDFAQALEGRPVVWAHG